LLVFVSETASNRAFYPILVGFWAFWLLSQRRFDAQKITVAVLPA
jgi:hypothetical protein